MPEGGRHHVAGDATVPSSGGGASLATHLANEVGQQRARLCTGAYGIGNSSLMEVSGNRAAAEERLHLDGPRATELVARSAVRLPRRKGAVEQSSGSPYNQTSAAVVA